MQAIAAFEALDMSAENHNALTAPLTPPPTPPNTLTTDGPGDPNTAVDALPTRTQYMANLSTLRGVWTGPSQQYCGHCNSMLQKQKSMPSKGEKPIVLHGEHMYGEECARRWFEGKNTCPICGYLLFTEELGMDDAVNLKRIWHLRNHQQDLSAQGKFEKAGVFYAMWRSLADERAQKYLRGEIEVDKTLYAIYNQKTYSAVGSIFYPVDASNLCDKLERLWEGMFNAFNRPFGGASIPCHPLTSTLRDDMISTLRMLDRVPMTAWQLAARLDAAFTSSWLYTVWQKKTAEAKMPQGFFVYRTNLVRAVVEWHMASQ